MQLYHSLLQQLWHLHYFVHAFPKLKHSQYFFIHPVFLHIHPPFTIPPI